MSSPARALVALAFALGLALGPLAGCGWKTGLVDDPVAPACIDVSLPTSVEVSTSARLSSADVLFLVDQTGSMREEIEQIRSSLTGRIIPGIRREIPDVRFGVAAFGDLPLVPYGGPSETAFVQIASMTSDDRAIRDGIDMLAALDVSGGDLPEAQVLALHLVATGEGFGSFVTPPSCPPDAIGYPCFRPTGARIILLFTDASFHNGPGGENPYGFIPGPPPPTYVDAVDALDAIGARVVGLYSGTERNIAHSRAIARDTGALSRSGTPLVFDIGTEGERLGESVVDAVRDLASDALLEVDAIAEDVEGDLIDATRFVRTIVPSRAEPRTGARIEGDRFVDVLPRTRLFFRVELANDFIEPTEVPQRIPLRIVFRDRGVPSLGDTVVEIVVPAVTGEGCAAPTDL